METNGGKGVDQTFKIGPLAHGGGSATMMTFRYPSDEYIYRIEIFHAEYEYSAFEYFTDEQMQELFLAYIALKEAREAQSDN